MAPGIDITDLQSQSLAQPQPHGIGGQHKDAIAQFSRGADELRHLRDAEHIRQSAHLGWLDHFHPLPIQFEYMLPEELEPITIDPHCTPGVAVDQPVKMPGQLIDTELLGETVETIDEASYGAGIDIDGAGAVPVQFQGAQVFPVKRIKAFLFTGIHSSVDCRQWATEELTWG